ncbi:MAG: hypothetical protein IJO45_02380 [Oscillospiraceae bacterium]|nr:hypothetical protein [Oscillospiraceae bacterium]
MDEKELQQNEDTQEFSLEDIMKEFGGEPEEALMPETTEEPAEEEPAVEEPAEEEPAEEEAAEEEAAEEEAAEDDVAQETATEETPVGGDTIRMEPLEKAETDAAAMGGATIRMDVIDVGSEPQQVKGAAPIAEEADKEPFSDQWEPEYEQPMGEYIPPRPILIHPRSRLKELKAKLVAGPEKRYYILSELGLGKLQAAIFLSLLVVLLSAGSTVMYAMGMVSPERLRLMIFGQFLAMMVSALLGSGQLVEGVAELFKGRFTLNTLLVVTFIACVADGVLCLRQLRIPCCAAFSVEMTMALWAAYERRNTEMGQMDTLRKATHLDSIRLCKDYYGGKKSFLRGEGEVEDFMDHYNAVSKPEKVLSWYALAAMVASVAIGVVAVLFHGVGTGVQVAAVCLLAAVPGTMFVTLTRPMAVLEKKLHDVGAVICGWQGVEGLCGKGVFPIGYEDLFPVGCAKMNGVKFFGSRPTDEVVAYATALVAANGSGLAPIFTQVLDSRHGRHYDVEEFRVYDNGGIGGVVCDESVLVGPMSFMKEMGVDVPEGLKVNQAICVAVDGELCGLFAPSYENARTSAVGLTALCSNRGLNPIVISDDFLLTESFVRSRFGVKPRKVLFPQMQEREALRKKTAEDNMPGLALSTREGLASYACSVSGARALRTASRMGVAVHMIGGILGLAIMATLTVLGALELLTPANVFAYQLVWMFPGLLITEWTRTA